MKKEILLNNKRVAYVFRRVRRARKLRLTVYCGGNVVLTAPWHIQETMAEKFVAEKAKWLISKLSFFEALPKFPVSRGRKTYRMYKEKAFVCIKEKVDYFSRVYGYQYNKISIKNQKTCWGSCSRKRNLNFNYNISFLPENMQDYIVVHEVCHLKELSHSKSFWKLVEKTMPDYAVLRKALKQTHLG